MGGFFVDLLACGFGVVTKEGLEVDASPFEYKRKLDCYIHEAVLSPLPLGEGDRLRGVLPKAATGVEGALRNEPNRCYEDVYLIIGSIFGLDWCSV